MDELTHFLMDHGGPLLFGIVFAEQAGLPLPAAPWLLAAGALSAVGSLHPGLAIGLSALACLLADWIWFYVGRRGGQRVLRWFCRLSLSPNYCVLRSKNLFARRGAQSVVAAKFIPVLGTVVPPMAGALGMSTGRFLFYDSLGSVIYAGVYVAAGCLFHNQLQEAAAWLSRLGIGALVLAVAAPGFYIAFKYIRRRRASAEPAARPQGPLPEMGEVALVDAALRPAPQAAASPLLPTATCQP